MDRIQVDHLGKRYRLGERDNLRETLAGIVKRNRTRRNELWSLRDVSFNVADGEAVGVIGHNGAGKSTLLKLLMRITAPTTGVARTRGRVAALLEVGTGFHPELTGRENVFLNAAVLGMSRRDTRARFDEIVDFAGTGQFLDTPVKRYSSGMYLRLAFAVAAHLEPDILVVDEVLAVGDAEFQRKCLNRMSSAGREGRTVVFVSHDLASLARICPRSVWLQHGQLCGDGPSDAIIRDYLSSTYVSDASSDDEADEADLAGRGPIALRRVTVHAPDGPQNGALLREDPLQISVEIDVREEQLGLDLAVYVTNARGVRVFDELVSDSLTTRFPLGIHRLTLDVPPILNVGQHTVGIWIGTQVKQLLEQPAAASFELLGSARSRPERAVVLDLPFRRAP